RAAAISPLESSLRRAIEQQEFVVHYQPIISLESSKMVGVEALLRWQDPARGLIDPEEFLAVAEEVSLLQAINEWVMESAFRQAKVWREISPSLYLSLNVFPQQLESPEFVSRLQHLLQETGLPPSVVTLEIAENFLTKTADRFAKTLSDLKEIGLKLTIDDFGTGQSSLGYLKRFHPDALKIDPSMIQDLAVGTKHESVASTVISLAHSLELKVVAEGVHTDEQLAFLRWHHCDEIQGSLLSPPVSAADVTALLKTNREYC
ncbi:MAG TPA: EAL domain-containing protein, partial [Acidobacteriota bacterium]